MKRFRTSRSLPHFPTQLRLDDLGWMAIERDRRNFCHSSLLHNSRGGCGRDWLVESKETHGRLSDEYTLNVHVRLRPRQASSIVSFRERDNGLAADAEIAVGAHPVDGEANEELVEFLSGVTKLPKSDIQIVKGATNKQKVIRLKSHSESPFRRIRTNLDDA